MIEANLNILHKRIEDACQKAGRSSNDVKLIAVSKNHAVKDILEALNCGQIDFGENRVQELNQKYEEIGNKAVWHLIGTLQSNKVKYAVKMADFIHSVDSLKLAEEINKQALKNDRKINILLQYKTSDELSKSGIETEDELLLTAEKIKELEYLEFKGLMTIAPLTDDETLIRHSFSKLRDLKDKLINEGHNITELSMGMSDDFEIAIEEGATMIRVGSAIFGARDYSLSWKNL